MTELGTKHASNIVRICSNKSVRIKWHSGSSSYHFMINATIHRVYHGKLAIYLRNDNKENQRHDGWKRHENFHWGYEEIKWMA